jgi:multiple antibiotic resistance protein
VVSLAFVAIGGWIFRWLGISVSDFQISGGILLLVFAVTEILQRGPRELPSSATVGVVPLGTPLLVGPAVLTSLLILVPLYGYGITLAALLSNLFLATLAMVMGRSMQRFLHENGLRAISQVINLFLAAIAVSLIRRGVETLFGR